jgi:hypothetical protein
MGTAGFRATLLCVGLLSVSGTVRSQENDGAFAEHPKAIAYEQYEKTYAESLKILSDLHFQDKLQFPSLGSAPGAESRVVEAIQAERPIAEIGHAVRGTVYDVILQPGHYGRPPGPGNQGTHGRFVSERALATYLTDALATELRNRSLSVLVVPANDYLKHESRDPLRTKIFLAIHADGKNPPCNQKGTLGASMGYKPQDFFLAMHTVGAALGAAMGYGYDDFHRDNYTPNEANYQWFNSVNASVLKGILEVGELTCPHTEDRLIASAPRIAYNLATALQVLLQYKYADSLPP